MKEVDDNVAVIFFVDTIVFGKLFVETGVSLRGVVDSKN